MFWYDDKFVVLQTKQRMFFKSQQISKPLLACVELKLVCGDIADSGFLSVVNFWE